MYPPYFLTIGETGNPAISMIVQQTNRALIDIYRRLPEETKAESKIIVDVTFKDSTDFYLIENLDINTDKVYKFYFYVLSPLSAFFRIYINSDTVDTNYSETQLYTNGTTYGDEILQEPRIIYVTSGKSGFAQGTIMLNNSVCLINGQAYRTDDYIVNFGIRTIEDISHVNINSIAIASHIEDGIGIGSRLILEKI